MPEATGLQILSDTLDAVRWVHRNISDRIIIAGSSAGGYLALATGAHPECPRPLSILSIYGMLDPASKRYIETGTPLRAPISNLETALEEIETAADSGQSIDGYAFPSQPPIDQRFRWIAAIHESARYPDLLTRISGLACQIREEGVRAIPVQFRNLFPVSFRLSPGLPPTVLLHGDSDELVDFEQSALVAEKMKLLGIDVHLERAVGQGHGFDAKNSINLDTIDMEGEDAIIKAGLRRVILALEASVAKVSI
jgi:acetyl esterase/lipase